MLPKQIASKNYFFSKRFNLTQSICTDKIGYHRFNIGAQISLSLLLSFHFQKMLYQLRFARAAVPWH